MNDTLTAAPALAAFDRRVIPPTATIGHWTASDGWPIRRFDWPATDPRGAIMVQGGRGDIFEKYLETFAHWHAQGWSITAFDWRGHGGSGRPALDLARGEFTTAVADLAAIWRDWAAEARGPRVLLGHSMGGYLTLRATLEGAVSPAALVLIAPMLGLRSPFGRFSPAVARLMRGLGDPARKAWKTNERPGGRVTRQGLLTSDPDRYADEDWWHAAAPDHVLGPPSWAWLAEAFEATTRLQRDPRLATLATPVLMLVAEADGLVDARAAVRVGAALRDAELIRFGDESAHEILREADPVRTRALAGIDDFLARRA